MLSADGGSGGAHSGRAQWQDGDAWFRRRSMPRDRLEVDAVVADGVVVVVGDVLDGGGDKVGGGEDFEVALGFPVVAGTVDDGGGLIEESAGKK